MKNIILFLAVACAAIGFYACQETDAVFFDEPRVRMVLYNNDSLADIKVEVSAIEIEVKQLKDSLTLMDSIGTIILDSLNTLDSLVTVGRVEFKPQLDSIVIVYEQLQLDYETNKMSQDTLNKIKSGWLKVADQINSGLMFLTSITNLNNDKVVVYEDSSIVWSLPLDMNHDSVKLALEVDNVKYLLGLTYNRATILDELSRLTVESSSLRLIEFDDAEYERTGTVHFDSVKLKCKTLECIDNEASIAIYY